MALITYDTHVVTKNRRFAQQKEQVSPVTQKIQMINEAFSNSGYSPETDYKSLIKNPTAFNSWMSQLTEDMDPYISEEFEVIAKNIHEQMLQESHIAGISPVTAMTLPMLRIGYPKMAVREGIPTEPVLTPKFSLHWKRPYIIDFNTNEHIYLPAALRSRRSMFSLPKLSQADIPVGTGGLVGFDLFNFDTNKTYLKADRSLQDSIDVDFSIVNLTTYAVPGEDISEMDLNAIIDMKDFDINNPVHQKSIVRVRQPIEAKLQTNDMSLSAAFAVTHPSTGFKTRGRINCKLNLQNGIMDFMSLCAAIATLKDDDVASISPAVKSIKNAIESFNIRAFLTSEYNNRAVQVGFEFQKEEIVIGTGQPIEASINIQHMTDVMAMYNIDATVYHLEIMSDTLARKVDFEGMDFIERCWERSPYRLYTEFNVNPPANFTHGEYKWREHIKIYFDQLITRLQETTYYRNGECVVFCNPMDAQVLSNTQWTQTEEHQPNGANVEYKVGVYQSDVTKLRVLSSYNFDEGTFWILFLSSDADQKTYAYHPYSFNVVRGSSSPNTPNVPSIMMLKRHIFKEYTPMICRVNLIGNGHYKMSDPNGNVYMQQNTYPTADFNNNAMQPGNLPNIYSQRY